MQGNLVQYLILGFMCLGPMVAIYLMLTMAKRSGWDRLAASYPGPKVAPEGAQSGRSGNIGRMIQMKFMLTVGPTAEGLYLGARNFGHEPVFVPWSEVVVGPPEAQTFATKTALTFSKVPGFQLDLWGDIGDKVYDAKPKDAE